MRVLMLGVKEYPYGMSSQFEKYPGGGTAREVLALSNELVKLGLIIDLIVRKMPCQRRYESDNGLNIYRVKWLNNRYLRLPSFSFFSFIEAIKIIKYIDLIHAHGSFDGIFGIILSKMFNKPVVGTPHGLTSFQAKERYNKISVYLTRLLERWSFSRLDKVIFVSENEREKIVTELRIKPKSYQIINIGIHAIKIKRKLTNKFVVVFIGRLVPSKGIDKLIRAFSLLPDDIRKASECIIVGDGYHRNVLETMISCERLVGLIRFTGYQKNIGQYLSSANLFILPSEGGEGLPSSLLEAMSVGVPCMISNFKIEIDDNSIIYLVNNSALTIADKLEYYYYHQDKLKKIGENGKREFHNHFEISNVVKEFLHSYNMMLK